MKRFTLALIIIALLLSACSTSRRLGQHPQSLSRPNHSSMYYYMAASLQFLDGYYDNAWTLYQRALNQDPNSPKIKKEMLMSAMYHHLQQPSADAGKVKSLIDANRSFILQDGELLDAAYGFYSTLRDTVSQRWALDNMLAHHPGARAHVLNFLYSYSIRGNPDTALLHPALDYIQNDSKQLLYLGSMFEAVDPYFSMKAAQRLYEIEPNDANTRNLARLYLQLQISAGNYSFFDALDYPKDQQLMHYILDAAFSYESWDFLNHVAPEMIATNDNDLTYIVTVAALMERNSQAFAQLETSFQPDSSTESGYILSLIIANSFLADDDKDLAPLLDSITCSTDLENIIRFYTLAISKDLPPDQAPPDSVFTEFAGMLQRRVPEGLKKDYLIVTTLAIPDEDEEAETRYNQTKERLIVGFMQQGFYNKDDIAWLLQRYYFTERMDERIPLLRLAIREYPDSAIWFNDLGYTLLITDGDLDEAGELIFKALSMEPQNNFYLDSIAWYFYLKKDYQQALNYITPVMEMENMPAEIAYHIGLIHMRLADYDTATQYMKYASECTEEDPDFAEKAKRALEIWGK